MMNKRSIGWALMLFGLACKTWAATTIVPLDHFNSLKLNGELQVEVKAGQTVPKLQIEATSGQLSTVFFTVKQQELTINQRGSCCKDGFKPKLIIQVPTLNSLIVKGKNKVTITNLHSREFYLFSENQGDIDIQGVVGLKELSAQGKGFINIYWVNTPKLNVWASAETKILLGGKVENLHANMAKQSSLNARYLATTNAYVRTADCARVDIAAKQILNAEAIDTSNIYYYQQPAFLGQHMFGGGSVLNVVGQPLVN